MNSNSFDWFKLDNAATIFPGQNSSTWSNVFRLGIQLKKEVEPELIDKALENVLKRIPCFNVRIRSGFFWHYFEKNPESIKSRPDVRNYCYRIKFKEDKGFLFRVFYLGKRISIDVYHALSDGYGATVFISTLIGEYLRLSGEKVSYNQYVLDPSEAPKKSEVEDAYCRYANSKAPYNRKDKWVYHATGTKLPKHMCNYTIGIMSFKQVHALSKSYGVTVTEFFASLLIYVHYKKQLQEKKKQREICAQIPVNLRKAFPSETLRNFVLCLRVKIDPNLGEYTFEEILRSVSLQLKLANDPKLTNSLMTQNLKLEKNPVMKYLPVCIKDLGISVSFVITGEQTTTALLSNLGSIALPEDVAQHIDYYTFFTGPGKLNGARCGAVTHGDKLVLSFSNCYEESDIEREFFTSLVKMGIHVKIESNRN